MSSVDPIKGRRAGVGLRALDPSRAYPGYTLFAPLTAATTVYLVDLLGQIAHTWTLPYPPGLYGYLTDHGTLLYNARIADPAAGFLGSQPWKGGAVLEVDWRGRVRWEVRHPDHHHDGVLLRNGHVMLLCQGAVPPEIAARVRGGRPGTEHDGVMYGDYLVEMTTAGGTVWEWRAWEHLDPEVDGIAAPQDPRNEWTHANTVVELPDGNIALSFRNTSQVVIVDRGSGEIIWRLGPPVLAPQHAPAPLPNGHLLIFDNGTHRADHWLPFSRVLEVDPATRQIVWQYQERRIIDFFSPLISNAQRLPNGNTLICEGSYGRLFEVTPDGDVVWEYVNPFFGLPAGGPNPAPTNAVFRAFRYSEAEVARAATNV